MMTSTHQSMSSSSSCSSSQVIIIREGADSVSAEDDDDSNPFNDPDNESVLRCPTISSLLDHHGSLTSNSHAVKKDVNLSSTIDGLKRDRDHGRSNGLRTSSGCSSNSSLSSHLMNHQSLDRYCESPSFLLEATGSGGPININHGHHHHLLHPSHHSLSLSGLSTSHHHIVGSDEDDDDPESSQDIHVHEQLQGRVSQMSTDSAVTDSDLFIQSIHSNLGSVDPREVVVLTPMLPESLTEETTNTINYSTNPHIVIPSSTSSSSASSSVSSSLSPYRVSSTSNTSPQSSSSTVTNLCHPRSSLISLLGDSGLGVEDSVNLGCDEDEDLSLSIKREPGDDDDDEDEEDEIVGPTQDFMQLQESITIKQEPMTISVSPDSSTSHPVVSSTPPVATQFVLRATHPVVSSTTTSNNHHGMQIVSSTTTSQGLIPISSSSSSSISSTPITLQSLHHFTPTLNNLHLQHHHQSHALSQPPQVHTMSHLKAALTTPSSNSCSASSTSFPSPIILTTSSGMQALKGTSNVSLTPLNQVHHLTQHHHHHPHSLPQSIQHLATGHHLSQSQQNTAQLTLNTLTPSPANSTVQVVVSSNGLGHPHPHTNTQHVIPNVTPSHPQPLDIKILPGILQLTSQLASIFPQTAHKSGAGQQIALQLLREDGTSIIVPITTRGTLVSNANNNPSHHIISSSGSTSTSSSTLTSTSNSSHNQVSFLQTLNTVSNSDGVRVTPAIPHLHGIQVKTENVLTVGDTVITPTSMSVGSLNGNLLKSTLTSNVNGNNGNISSGEGGSTSSETDRPFKCELCNSTFTRLGNYTRHKKIHSLPTKRFRCDLCSKSFIQRCDLARHLHIHRGTEPHRCPQCGKGYIRHSDLVTHQRFHNKEKPFACPHCSKGFCQRGDLNRHLRSIHLQLKPILCTHCHKKFAKEETLLRHINSAHRDKLLDN